MKFPSFTTSIFLAGMRLTFVRVMRAIKIPYGSLFKIPHGSKGSVRTQTPSWQGIVKISCAQGTPPSLKTRDNERRESFQRKDEKKLKAMQLVSWSRCPLVPG
jgi:hypothetical protein